MTEFCELNENHTFLGAITGCETFRPPLTPYGLIMTQAKCNFYGICREVTDGKYPELKAMINRNEKEGANKQVISSQADSLIKISRIWAD
ncbi:hypothetical protein, partial [Enterobacter roggenkampii]|uniref:hypothetical protein n=1 Tax=Enterobacter roggenkampii TaxID=1812935 RepID=UPI0013787CB9